MMITSRLTLSVIQESDFSFIRILVNTEGWLTFIGDRQVYEDDHAIDYIKRIRETPTIYWVVRERFSNNAIGIITLIKRDYLPLRDLGFAFLPEYVGKGYAYEAASAAMNWAFQNNYFPLLATTVPENTKSIQLLKRLGMKYAHDIIHQGDTLSVYRTPEDATTLP